MQDTIHLLKSHCTSLPFYNPTIEWSDMSSNTLAKTRTFFYYSDNVWKPNGYFEIYVNPQVHWWNGHCENIPYGMYDLKSVLLHEVLHGIGFLSTIDENKDAFPVTYDLLIRDASNHKLVSNGEYSGSFGQPIYIDGLRLYNPSTFDSGSSFSHLDSEFRIMSSSISHQMCRRTLDTDTARVMKALGHTCSNTPVVRPNPSTSIEIYIFVGSGALLLLSLLLCACCCKTSGRRKRQFDTYQEYLNFHVFVLHQLLL